MKIVVTGGAGFIGSNLVDRLVTDGHDVLVLDHYKREKQRFENIGARLFPLSIGDDAVRELFQEERPDAVCHLAAHISVTASLKDPVQDAHINIIDGLKLGEAAKASGVKKFVFASSGGAIYAAHPVIPAPLVPNPLPPTPYGIGKLVFEHYLRASGIPSICLRFSNVYGPRQMPGGEAGVIAIMINKLLSGEPMTIYGDGTATRDYVYVDDVVEAFVAALAHEVTGPINIGTGKETSVNVLWDLLNSIHGGGGVLRYEPTREGDVMRSAIDASSAHMIHWEPNVSIEEGLKRTYDWFWRSEVGGRLSKEKKT